MKADKKILHFGIGFMILTLLICMGFTLFITLDHPVFFRYCIEVPISPEQTATYNQSIFQLEYITNKSEDTAVTGISFDKVNNLSFHASENPPWGGGFTIINSTPNTTLGSVTGKYSLRTVYVYLSSLPEEGWNEDIQLKSAQIEFSDGEIFTVDLGSIILYNESRDRNSLTNDYSSNSTYGNQYTSFQLKEDITLLGLESSLIDLADDILELKVNDIRYDSIDGMYCRAGSRLEVSSLFTITEDELSEYDVYDLRPKLNYKKSDGTIGSNRIYNINHRHYYVSFTEILKYLWKRGEL